MSDSRRRSVRGLLGSWVVYWMVAGTVKLGPLIVEIWRATHGQPSATSSVSASLTNAVLNVLVMSHGHQTYTGSVHLAALALWIAGVPLAVWLAWLATARSPDTSTAERANL